MYRRRLPVWHKSKLTEAVRHTLRWLYDHGVKLRAAAYRAKAASIPQSEEAGPIPIAGDRGVYGWWRPRVKP